VAIVKKRKITSAIINFGGDIYAHGKKPNEDKFKIAIKNPKDKNNNFYQQQSYQKTA
jgi:thiamine biosynthesis lipoprotein